jgi:RNA polymerase sigma factor (sigma-70 family)
MEGANRMIAIQRPGIYSYGFNIDASIQYLYPVAAGDQRTLNANHMIDNSLTSTSFDNLLAHLGPDRESAARAYIELRRALFIFFAARGAATPDEMTDETINRVARRLTEGKSITTESPANYFYGVARNVWRESLTKGNVLIPLSDDNPLGETHATPYDLLVGANERLETEIRHDCLEKCLERLDPKDRALVLSYYQFSGGEKIENRKKIAAELGLSSNTLRQKVARLRSKLAECMTICKRSRAPS